MCLPPTKLGSGCMHNDISNVQKSAQFLSPAQNFEQSLNALLPKKLTLGQFMNLKRSKVEPCSICGGWCGVQHILGFPVSNTGVKSNSGLENSHKNSNQTNQKVIIDTLTFSFCGISFDYDVRKVSKWLLRWTGDILQVGGPVEKHYNGYSKCYALVLADGTPSPMLGWLGVSSAHDPMKGRWCIHLTGVGCSCVNIAPVDDYVDGVKGAWERLAMDALDYGVKITRVDLAVDDLSGEHSISLARKLYDDGAFSTGGRPPTYKYIQTSEGCGNTFYVGKLESGKCLRVYEKGKQLGCKSSTWVRWEAQIMAINRNIPVRVLLEPDKYLRGAYPNSLTWIGKASLMIETKIEKGKLLLEHAMKSAKQQVGSLVRYLKDAKGVEDAVIIQHLIGREGKYPLRLFEYVLPDGPWLSPG